jgi:hypothetical protein
MDKLITPLFYGRKFGNFAIPLGTAKIHILQDSQFLEIIFLLFTLVPILEASIMKTNVSG